mgnify:FL=1
MSLVSLSTGPDGLPTPYVTLNRAEWARLRDTHPMSLTEDEVTRLRGLGDPLELTEVE